MVFATTDEKNIFIDSESGVVGSGTDFRVNFPAEMFSVKDPDHIRLTLKQFNMKRNIGNMYNGNNFFWLVADGSLTGGVGRMYPVIIETGNYINMDQQATALVNALNTTFAFAEAGGTFNGFTYQPNTFFTSGGGALKCQLQYVSSTRKYKFVLTDNGQIAPHLFTGNMFYFCCLQVTNPTGPNVASSVTNGYFSTGGVPVAPDVLINMTLQCDGVFQDSGALLGGRTSRMGTPLPILKCMWDDVSTAGGTVFESPYAVQLATMDKVFLRTSIQSENCQSLGFDSASGDAQGQIVGSQIFASIPNEPCCASAVNNSGNTKFNIGALPVWTPSNPFPNPSPFSSATGQIESIMPNYETIHWEDKSGSSIFTMLIDGQQLGQVRFYLTDSKGRLLLGEDPQQGHTGNLFFKMVIRYEAVEIGRIGYLTNQPSLPIPVPDEIVQEWDFQSGKANPLSS